LTRSNAAHLLAHMFAILGASGKVGRATIKALTAQGAQVRAVVRETSGRADLEALGCEVAFADLRDKDAIRNAIKGASAVQVICPVSPRAQDARSDMANIIDSITAALIAVDPETVLAISDYGAEVESGSGITMTFHYMEDRLSALPGTLILLRSAEHMQNWARVFKPALETGVLPSFHHPVSKIFPTISAPDLGPIAAELLLEKSGGSSGRRHVVHAEGPRRYSALDVAQTMSEISGRQIVARELPETDWIPTLTRGGAGESYAELVRELYVAHNAGRIDVEPGGEVRLGPTELREAFRAICR
jgi:NAD(P)H dehydrogenase (quinone)